MFQDIQHDQDGGGDIAEIISDDEEDNDEDDIRVSVKLSPNSSVRKRSEQSK